MRIDEREAALLQKASNFKAAGVLSQDQHLFEEPQNVNGAGDCPGAIPHIQIFLRGTFCSGPISLLLGTSAGLFQVGSLLR
jgi:hypothetical protein